MSLTPIHRIQGSELLSPFAKQLITTRGVVTGHTRKGFFVQDPEGDPADEVSHGIFIFERRSRPVVGSLVEVHGKVVDYSPGDNARPTTQIEERETRVLQDEGPAIEPFWLTAERVFVEQPALARLLNSLEGMLVGIAAGGTFVAPSNPFGDYVVLPADASLRRTQHGGVLIDPQDPERWLPGFRVLNYGDAPEVHVGAELLEPVVGPLNFRVASYQIAAPGPVRASQVQVERQSTTLEAEGSAVTVLTLNGFNLDAHVERKDLVLDPARDVDDDVASGRFDGLARAIAVDARAPDVVALQEIQDDDGAEQTEVTSAEKTLRGLVKAVQRAGGPEYAFADLPPEAGADGGQPGGNIRNSFLYRPERVQLVEGSLARLGEGSEVFEGSRKPLAARFRVQDGSGGLLEVINVHLASKRHQYGLFAPEQPGFDPRLDMRIRQVEYIGAQLALLRAAEVDYYVTGDFNDFEFSDTLQALVGDHSTNLVDHVPEPLRFDYNHRGLSEALMHGVVANRQLDGRKAEYEILHGNALQGTPPGSLGRKPSDHGYVIARLQLV